MVGRMGIEENKKIALAYFEDDRQEIRQLSTGWLTPRNG